MGAMTQLTEKDYLEVITRGLATKGGESKRVIVIGAGMAGLVAASVLKSAGHHPVILEARGRVGGRIYTIRAPFSSGLYGEAGAMRIPRSHALTMAYVEQFGLQTRDFTMDNPKAFCHYGGQRFRFSEVNANPGLLPFELTDSERNQTAGQIWETALQPVVKKIELEGWDSVIREYDQFSVREFLEEVNGWSEGAIERFGLLFNQEALMNSSFMELLREETGNNYSNMVYLVGGTDSLPDGISSPAPGSDPFWREDDRLGPIG